VSGGGRIPSARRVGRVEFPAPEATRTEHRDAPETWSPDVRVLVTGGTGFIGSHTAEATQRAGHSLRLLARDPAKVERVFGARGVPVEEVVPGDVTDPAAVARALDGCDAVVHAAAVVALEASRAREVRETNLRAVELVVGGAHERGLRSIVYVSSLGALFSPGGPPISEDAPVGRVRSAYALSKAEGERFVRELERQGAPIRASYPPAVIGPDDPGLSEGNHMIRAFLRDLMVITSSGLSLLDVRDLAHAHARMLDPEADNGRYVIPGRFLSWAETVALMDEVTGRRVRRFRVPGPLLRVLGRLGDLVKRVRPFDFPLTGEAMDFATQWPGAVASPAFARLGVELRDVGESCEDAIRWMHEAGHLEAGKAGRLAR
jgi:nucleoside-diphosphate-sugar epimerase